MSVLLTVEDGLKQIHTQYEGDSDFLDFDDDESAFRFELLKQGIISWIDRFPQLRETFTPLSAAVDGDKTTTNNLTTYDSPTNFMRPVSDLYINGERHTYVVLNKFSDEKMRYPSKKMYTFLGAPGSYKILVNPAPAGSLPIEYDYYAGLTLPTLANNIIPISRPLYAIYFALNKLFADDESPRAGEYQQMMEEQYGMELAELSTNVSEPVTLHLPYRTSGFGQVGNGPSNILTGE